jgi:hypothetical protein
MVRQAKESGSLGKLSVLARDTNPNAGKIAG